MLEYPILRTNAVPSCAIVGVSASAIFGGRVTSGCALVGLKARIITVAFGELDKGLLWEDLV